MHCKRMGTTEKDLTKTEKISLNPFTPEPPITTRADPGPFYPL